MRKVIVYIASSLDGFIARKNHDISWLEAYNSPDEDHGYTEFIKNVGTAIMGARSYEQSLIHPERVLAGIKNYILSSKQTVMSSGIETEFYNGDLGDLVQKIKQESDKDIFVVGGGKVVSEFLNAGLVDDLFHFIVPILLTDGIPLYINLYSDITLQLVESTSYTTGITKLHFNPKLL